MKNKIFLSLIVILFFLIIISCNADVSAFTFSHNDVFYDTDNYGEIDLLNYSCVLYSSSISNYFYLFSFSVEPHIYSSRGSYYLSFDICDNVYCLLYKNGKKYYKLEENTSGVTASFDQILYSNFDVKYENGEVFYKSNEISYIEEFILYKSTNEYTTNLPLVIYSQNFNEVDILNYNIQYSKDNESWVNCDVRSINNTVTGDTFYQFKLDVYENGTYHFRLKNEETGEYLYNNVIVDNIIYTQDNYNNYINGEFMPQPWFNYDYVSDTEIKMYSQAFTEEEIRQLECSYGKDLETGDLDNDEKWSTLDVESSYSDVTRSYEYRFIIYIDNSNYDGDGEYYFRFYIKDKDEYTYGSFSVIFDEIIKYNNSLNKEETNKYLTLFRDRFGFLFYPFDLFISIFDHLSNIKFEEPVISIPDINEPFTNVKIISAVEFNFNDLLKNDILKNVHDIYLIIIDGFVVFSLSNLLYKKLMGVLGNG